MEIISSCIGGWEGGIGDRKKKNKEKVQYVNSDMWYKNYKVGKEDWDCWGISEKITFIAQDKRDEKRGTENCI